MPSSGSHALFEKIVLAQCTALAHLNLSNSVIETLRTSYIIYIDAHGHDALAVGRVYRCGCVCA